MIKMHMRAQDRQFETIIFEGLAHQLATQRNAASTQVNDKNLVAAAHFQTGRPAAVSAPDPKGNLIVLKDLFQSLGFIGRGPK